MARRERELAETKATLTLVEAGTRPEEIDAERARLDRLREEWRYLNELHKKQRIESRVAGVVTTPRFRECVGRYYREGELLCVIEEPALVEVEIGLSEKEIVRVQTGQLVELKVHGLPLETIAATVARIAPRAKPGAVQGSVAVYCRLNETNPDLRAGMSGHARVYTGRRCVGAILLDRFLRLLRAEFR